MKNRVIKIGVATAAILVATSSLFAASEPSTPVTVSTNDADTQTTSNEPKWKLNENMTIEYIQNPGEANDLTELFTKGIFYGRLRMNSFLWDWDQETDKNINHHSVGIGGSLIYRSASLNGISGTIGLYTSQNPGFLNMDSDEVGFVRSGKDVFSRLQIKQSGDWGMNVLGQAFLEYNDEMFNVAAGRLLFESVFTASNDTKMIPNTFDGLTASIEPLEKCTLRLAYLAQQKLRDHTTAHDVITFQDENAESWANNDDSGVHKGLSYQNFVDAGKDPDHELIIADFNTKLIDNLDATISFLQVPDVIQDIVLEAHYKIPLENGWALRPGLRYFYQGDDGGGAIAGNTNLDGKSLDGYASSVLGSLDADLIAARVDLLMPDKKGLLRLGYSKVGDKADIIAPWRGFPTDGFTRGMGQVNWYANTQTFMIQVNYSVMPQLELSTRYAIQDFDDSKKNVQADSNMLQFDILSKINKQLYVKGRIGIISADPANTGKADTSYNEYRLEANYLF